VKIGPVDPEIALLNFKKRKKSTQAKYIARSAGLPSGLNKTNIAPIYKSANAQIFSHYESANKLPRKRNIDRYREPQQRFAKPQTGLYTIRQQALCTVYHLYSLFYYQLQYIL